MLDHNAVHHVGDIVEPVDDLLQVIVNFISHKERQTAAANIRPVEFVQTDVADPGSVSALIRTTLETYGRLDCAVNNAGIEETQKGFLEWTEAEWERTIAVNLKGVWMCMQQEIPPMLKQGAGSIVNISSVAGLLGFPMLGPYVASKHGVLGLTKAAPGK